MKIFLFMILLKRMVLISFLKYENTIFNYSQDINIIPISNNITDMRNISLSSKSEKMNIPSISMNKSEYDDFSLFSLILNISIIFCIIIFSGIMSGLTVGYLSIDSLHLEIKMLSDNSAEVNKCKKIYNILYDRHRLLVTLLISNAAAMESLPLFINKLLPEWAVIIISTTLVLFIGEIIPQAVCTGKNQIAIASALSSMTQLLIWIMTPLNYPLGKLLDLLLGRHIKTRFINSDLVNLLELHNKSNKKEYNLSPSNISIHSSKYIKTHTSGSNIHKSLENKEEVKSDNYNDNQDNKEIIYHKDLGLIQEQVNVMISSIEIKNRIIKEVIQPISAVYSLNVNEKLSHDKIEIIVNSSVSYILVYDIYELDKNSLKNEKEEVGVEISYIGYIEVIDLMKYLYNKKVNFNEADIDIDYKGIIKKAYISHSYKSILFIYRNMLRTQNYFCFITENQNNNKVIGICTLNDISNYILNINIRSSESMNKFRSNEIVDS